jgi:hypothetical protein
MPDLIYKNAEEFDVKDTRPLNGHKKQNLHI